MAINKSYSARKRRSIKPVNTRNNLFPVQSQTRSDCPTDACVSWSGYQDSNSATACSGIVDIWIFCLL